MNKISKDIFQYCLGALVVLAFFGILVLLIFMQPADNGVLNAMVGILSGLTAAVVTYFFGSSKGSSEKTDLMANK